VSDSARPSYALFTPSALPRLAVIGVALLVVAAAFAWTAGWFSDRLDPDGMIDTFEAVNGPHEGFRRNHAKGVCLAGWFESNGRGARLSTAEVFKPGRVPVFGRFSLAGGMPAMPDGPDSVRSMALNFTLPDGEMWRTGMIVLPVFPFRDAQALYEQMLAAKPAANGKPDPAKIAAFFAAHPEAAKAISVIKTVPFSSGFANAPYNGLNAFRFIAADGKATAVRWSMRPVDAFEPEPAETPKDKNYLFDDLARRLAKGPAQWHLILTLGEAGDVTNDATVVWPADRETVDAGTLSIESLSAEADGNCRDINFDPLVLPAGIEPSDDPLLSARSSAYSESFTRRAGEPKTPSAVQTGAVQPGKGN